MNEPDSARRYARKRLKAKNAVKVLLVVWFSVSGVVILFWEISGAHAMFWPVWPIVGIGIAVVAVSLKAYGPRIGYISDHDVDAEVARLGRRP
jgi:4-hydroxybenzoate polyprenyltransferase